MLFKSKKGRSPDASAAAVLIAIIGALIVLYILFIPPEERAKILEEGDNTISGISGEGSEEISALLLESPGRLVPLEEQEFEHEFSAVNIQVGEEGIELKKVNSLYIKRTLFSNKEYEIIFNVIELDNIKTSLLNFIVEEGKGRLMITLNDQEVFNRDISPGNVEPISLEDYLKQGSNTLKFTMASPGAKFWSSNHGSLSAISVIADVFRKESQESALTFVLTPEEKNNLKKVKLNFLPECAELEAGPLEITINNYQLYSAVPDCGVPNRALEFLPERLVSGENTLKFRTEKGWYLIDNIEISSETKEQKPKTYYFEIDEKYFKGDLTDLEKPYKYYCYKDDESIYLEYKGDYERTGWKCDDDETCEGNFKRYEDEESKGTVTSALCEDIDYEDNPYKYYCGEDGETIYFTYEEGSEQTTGWECEAGETCQGNFRRYDEEEDKDTVRAAICEEGGYGDYELQTGIDVTLYIEFEDESSEKIADILINGHTVHLDQRDREFETSIGKYVEEGTNAIKIEPDEILDIAELKIELES